MKKVKLHLDELAVETFDVVVVPVDQRGTVHGLASLPEDGCSQDAGTCVFSCGGSCITCPGLEGCTGPYWICIE